MIKNYLKITWRTLLKYKAFTFINLAGLTLALTGCLLIGLFVLDEFKFDKFHVDADRVFRVYDKRTDDQGNTLLAATPPVFSNVLKKEFPEVESTLRIMQVFDKLLFEVGDKKAYEENGIFAEPAFFDMFTLPLKEQASDSLLNDPDGVLLTAELAEKYFGKEKAVGKKITINKQLQIVKGVFEKIPSHFHMELNYVLPFANLAKNWNANRMENWVWQQFITYVKLKPNTLASNVQDKLQKIVIERAHPITQKQGFTYLPYLQALPDIHLTSAGFQWDNAIQGNKLYVNALITIALFVLIIACFNFINLATARALRRAKEVGIRKTIGAERIQLLIQFTCESVLLALGAIVISTALTSLWGLPLLNEFTGKHIEFHPFSNPLVGISLLATGLLVGIGAGIYPAILISGFKPVSILKGIVFIPSSSMDVLRKGLIVVQFTMSVLLIICSMIVYRQVNYMNQKDLGFTKEQLMFFPMRGAAMTNNYKTFKQELLQQPGVVSATMAYGFPGDIVSGDEIRVPGEGETKTFPARHFMIDFDYIRTMDLKLLAGRDFSESYSTDKDAAFVINETGVKELGFDSPEKAIGKTLHWSMWGDGGDTLKKGAVIGVVKDFHFESLHDKINTAVLQIFPDAYWKVALKINTKDASQTIAAVETVWKKFSPEFPMDYQFLDENFDKMYLSENKLSALLWIFTALAILVGCLGLFGLATYAAEQRVKEIGIRKVLGAGVHQLVVLLAKDFILLVVVASFIAIPIAWWSMHSWLKDFAYKVDMSIWIFALAIFSALLVALLTISSQAVKAALTNPVKSLRAE